MKSFTNLVEKSYFINVLLFSFLIISLFLSQKIVSNNYDDNMLYSKAYFLMNSHTIQNKQYYLTITTQTTPTMNSHTIQNKQYYPTTQSTPAMFNNTLLQEQYYLISKKECLKSPINALMNDKDYYLLSTKTILEKYDHKFLNTQSYSLTDKQNIKDAYSSYTITTSAIEPTYFILSYISHFLISYEHFILCINIIFIFIIYKFLQHFCVNYKIIFLVLLSSDFYFYALLSDIHRLKVAILFFLLTFLSTGRKRYLFHLLTITSHLQSVLFYIYFSSLILFKRAEDKFILRRNHILAIILGLIIMTFYSHHIIDKIYYYYDANEFSYRTVILCIGYITYLYWHNLKETLQLFLPLALLITFLSFIIGPDRINFMLMEFIFYVELNRLLLNHNFTLIILIPLITYNIYKLLNFINLGVS